MKKPIHSEKLLVDTDPPKPLSIHKWPKKFPVKEFQRAQEQSMQDQINALGPAKHQRKRPLRKGGKSN